MKIWGEERLSLEECEEYLSQVHDLRNQPMVLWAELIDDGRVTPEFLLAYQDSIASVNTTKDRFVKTMIKVLYNHPLNSKLGQALK